MKEWKHQVNIHEAKTHLSRLLARVVAGEEITIARAGKPIARLVPVPPEREDRIPGRYAGEGWISEDFNDPLPEELQRLFEGRDED